MKDRWADILAGIMPAAGLLAVAVMIFTIASWLSRAPQDYFPLMPEFGEDPAQALYAFEEEYSEPLNLGAGEDFCSIDLDLLNIPEDVSTIYGGTGLEKPEADKPAKLASVGPPEASSSRAELPASLRHGQPPATEGHGLQGKDASQPPLDSAPQDTGVKMVCLAPGQTVYGALKSLDLDSSQIAALVKVLSRKINLRKCRPGDRIMVYLDPKGRVSGLTYDKGLFESYEVARKEAGGYSIARKSVEFEKRISKAAGTFTNDLFSSFSERGLSRKLASRFADIFSTKVDFNTDIRLGDSFQIIYEEFWRNGRRMGYGRILAAAYASVSGVTHTALYFKDKKTGSQGYYSPDGTPFGSYFLKSPLKVYRITSRFTRRRFHPILKVYRPHYGVDLAAPTGTPVMAVADGVVSFVGWQRGYGRIVSIDHPGGYTTYYGHLSRFGKGIKKGRKVHQKQVIGYVGRSGYATGPHLDYRVKKNGRWINPFGIKIKTASRLSKKALERFKEATAPLLSALADSQGPKILAVEKTSLNSMPDDWTG